MRLRRAIVALAFALVLAMTLGACSRLSFVRPDVSRGDYTQTARVIQVSDGDRVPVLALRDQLLLAQHRLQAGQLDEAKFEEIAHRVEQVVDEAVDEKALAGAAEAAIRGAAEEHSTR